MRRSVVAIAMQKALIGAFAVGFLTARWVDTSRIVTPDQLRAVADVTQGAIIIATKITRNRANETAISPIAGTIDDHWLDQGSWNMIVGMCAGMTLTTQSHTLLLGDRTAASGSNFANFGNKLCFWRDSGERADCPPPEPECGQ